MTFVSTVGISLYSFFQLLDFVFHLLIKRLHKLFGCFQNCRCRNSEVCIHIYVYLQKKTTYDNIIATIWKFSHINYSKPPAVCLGISCIRDTHNSCSEDFLYICFALLRIMQGRMRKHTSAGFQHQKCTGF